MWNPIIIVARVAIFGIKIRRCSVIYMSYMNIYIYIYIYIYQQREQEDTKSEYFALTYSISSYDVWTHNIYLQNPEAPFISTRTVFFLIKTENLERKAKKGPSVLTALGIDNMYIYISCSWNVHDCTVHSIISPNSSWQLAPHNRSVEGGEEYYLPWYSCSIAKNRDRRK